MNAVDTVAAVLRRDPHALAAVSAALWGMVGRPVGVEDFGWARRVFGDAGPQTLHSALRATGALSCNPAVLQPSTLAVVLAAWAGGSTQSVVCTTIPEWLASRMPAAPSIREVLNNLIRSARSDVLLCSPYVDPEGIGLLLDALRGAAGRGVSITMLTHSLDDLHSPNARAIALLKREVAAVEAVHIPSALTTPDGTAEPLLVHAKLVVVDQRAAWIGSANLTRAGLMSNIELGVLLPDVGAYLDGDRLGHLLKHVR